MWNPIKIEFENLFSHKHSTYEFNENQCVVIFGKNLSDKSLDNNGAGKTTLFEAIAIALTNDSLRGVKKESFINRDEDVCRISFELYNAAMRMKLVIKRTFYRSNKPVAVEIWENDVLNTQVTSVIEANKRILELIGISREDLLRYFIISQDNDYTFFTASDSEKKEVMNRITSADVINPAMDELSNRLAELQPVLNSIDVEISRTEHRKETLEEQRQDIIDNDDSDKRIEDKQKCIKYGEEYIKQWKQSIREHDEDIANLDKQISECKIANADEYIEKRKDLREQIERLEELIDENNSVKSGLNAELNGVVSCPNCGEEFVPKSKLGISVKEAKDMLKLVEVELKEQKSNIEKLNDEVKCMTSEIKKCEETEELLNNLKRQKSRAKHNKESLEDNIKFGTARIKQLKDEIEEIKNEKANDKVIKGIDDKIKECDKSMVELRKKRTPVEESIEMVKFWQFNMGRSGFMTYLANRSVKIIEGITNSYLRKFGSDISVLINGFKILKSGEVREKIDVFISNDGITSEPFMAKSGGERGRVVLAGILGIQHLINLSTNGKGLNLLVLDEALSGIDCNGTMEIIKTIDKLHSTVLMITQNIEDTSICRNYIEVVKENGISRYV